jgi:hypothetical protein
MSLLKKKFKGLNNAWVEFGSASVSLIGFMDLRIRIRKKYLRIRDTTLISLIY